MPCDSSRAASPADAQIPRSRAPTIAGHCAVLPALSAPQTTCSSAPPRKRGTRSACALRVGRQRDLRTTTPLRGRHLGRGGLDFEAQHGQAIRQLTIVQGGSTRCATRNGQLTSASRKLRQEAQVVSKNSRSRYARRGASRAVRSRNRCETGVALRINAAGPEIRSGAPCRSRRPPPAVCLQTRNPRRHSSRDIHLREGSVKGNRRPQRIEGSVRNSDSINWCSTDFRFAKLTCVSTRPALHAITSAHHQQPTLYGLMTLALNI